MLIPFGQKKKKFQPSDVAVSPVIHCSISLIEPAAVVQKKKTNRFRWKRAQKRRTSAAIIQNRYLHKNTETIITIVIILLCFRISFGKPPISYSLYVRVSHSEFRSLISHNTVEDRCVFSCFLICISTGRQAGALHSIPRVVNRRVQRGLN